MKDDKDLITLTNEGLKTSVINHILFSIEEYKEKFGVQSVTYKNEKEIKVIWEKFRKETVSTLRGYHLGGHRLGFIHLVNEEVKNMISSERLEFLTLNGGYGSFWGSKDNIFNHSQ